MTEIAEIPTGTTITSENTSSQLTPDYAGKVLFYSFRFNQGSRPLHSALFNYLHAAQPDWKIQDAQAVERSAKSRIESFFYQQEKPDWPGSKSDSPIHKPFKKMEIDDALNNGLQEMQKKFNDEANDDKENAIRQMLPELLERDLHFLTNDNGRTRQMEDPTKVLSDPRSSFVIAFALQNKPTGVEELNTMFEDIGNYLKDPQNQRSDFWHDNNIGNKLNDVINLYNNYHLETKFSLPKIQMET